MKIALFGYGKMGQLIEELAVQRGHSIAAIVDVDRPDVNFSEVDVAIDFSAPEAAFDNISRCINNDVPVISGTTGWLDRYDEAVELCKEKSGAFLYASNFSLGVNVFFALNSYLARLMNPLEQYKVSLEEIHHKHKLDTPSGTAISIAEGIIEHSAYDSWKMDKASENEIPVTSVREGEVPGTHIVEYTSDVDAIEIRHTAHSRNGFALGAVIAAEWLYGKEGVFSMKDVLKLG